MSTHVSASVSGMKFHLREAAIDGRNLGVRVPTLENSEPSTTLLHEADLVIAVAISRDDASSDGLRFLRKALSMKAAELAALFGVRPESVSRWETGKAPIDRATWMALSGLVRDAANVPDQVANTLLEKRVVDLPDFHLARALARDARISFRREEGREISTKLPATWFTAISLLIDDGRRLVFGPGSLDFHGMYDLKGVKHWDPKASAAKVIYDVLSFSNRLKWLQEELGLTNIATSQDARKRFWFIGSMGGVRFEVVDPNFDPGTTSACYQADGGGTIIIVNTGAIREIKDLFSQIAIPR